MLLLRPQLLLLLLRLLWMKIGGVSKKRSKRSVCNVPPFSIDRLPLSVKYGQLCNLLECASKTFFPSAWTDLNYVISDDISLEELWDFKRITMEKSMILVNKFALHVPASNGFHSLSTTLRLSSSFNNYIFKCSILVLLDCLISFESNIWPYKELLLNALEWYETSELCQKNLHWQYFYVCNLVSRYFLCKNEYPFFVVLNFLRRKHDAVCRLVTCSHVTSGFCTFHKNETYRRNKYVEENIIVSLIFILVALH
ncbi:hypothetical protein HELRODRAFT_174912 [Helobdella robusta]|uniref:Uncharacterized protein n=1 Tax=Helobdella robusta TaxID=6412 RepID=T1F8L9_HELRO|nr:hypothetical protein HELRODRAFT_174912 [Helobdella robusta]ESO01357.1 hypothetical protein HELRODRAFT_174912 [Helobdella robusta]